MNSQEEYIKTKMKEFAQNIDEFSVGQTVLDLDGAECKIADKTLNTILVAIKRKISDCRKCNKTGILKKQAKGDNDEDIIIEVTCDECDGTKKAHYGIDCANWFNMNEFNKRFNPKNK